MQALDERIIRVTLDINNTRRTYEKLALSATGIKYANSNQNECEIRITNLDKPTRNYILTEMTPFNLSRRPHSVILEAGRKSYGVTRIFVGNVARVLVSQPPDITISLQCFTGFFQKGNIVASSFPPVTSLKEIARNTATSLGATLNYQADNKQISNYHYSGSALKQIDKLNETGVNAFLDDDVLIVKNFNQPLANRVRVLNSSTGLIGVPETTERGVRVKFLLDNITVIGGLLRVQSEINPAVNGDYVIYKLNFEIANRDTPFYYIAEGQRI